MTTTYLLDVRFARARALDGVGRFLWNVAHELPGALARDEVVALTCHPDDADAYRAHVPGARILPSGTPIASFAQYGVWPDFVAHVRPDVVHYPQFDMPRVPPGVASVATIYDFTGIDEPHYYGAGRAWRRVAAQALLSSTCARATAVTTLSDAIARAIEARAPTLAGRVHVTKPGPSLLATSTNERREPSSFVYVGNHRSHKRVALLVRAFARVRRELPTARLTLMGRTDPRFPLPPLGDGIILVENAADDVIAATLASARALVFPSVGEGYGFPVAEAQSLGTPAIVADAGSLPEVIDGAGLVVPRDDEEALARAILAMARDDALWRAVSTRASAVHRGRSWHTAATSLVGAWRIAHSRALSGRAL